MITQRQIVILETLIDRQFVSMDTFIEVTGMSERTVRYDISSLRRILEPQNIDIKFVSNRGFYIPLNHHVDVEKYVLSLNHSEGGIGHANHDDTLANELVLLLATQSSATIFELSERLFVSESKLRDVLQIIEVRLPRQLALKHERGTGIRITGSEFEIRRFASVACNALLRNTTGISEWYRSLYVIHDYLQEDELLEISANFKTMNLKYKIWYTKETYDAVFSYLIVQWLRVQYFLTQADQEADGSPLDTDSNAYHYAASVLLLDADHTQQDIHDFLNILASNHILINPVAQTSDALSEAIDSALSAFHEQKYDRDQLRSDLVQHLSVSIQRTENDLGDQGSLVIHQIKTNYPQYYHEASLVAKNLEKALNRPFSELEICYIAVYINKNEYHQSHRLRTVVVCSTGRGLSTLLTTRIKRVFPTIDVVDTMSVYQVGSDSMPEDVDFIISTVDIEDSIIPYVKISVVLSNHDIGRIQAFLTEDNRDVYPEMMYWTATHHDVKDGKTDFIESVEVMNTILLRFIECLSMIQQDFTLDTDMVLGLLIHIHLAIPRWVGKTPDDVMHVSQYLTVKSEVPNLAIVLDDFFEFVEKTLFVTLSINERLAFYTYIVRRAMHE